MQPPRIQPPSKMTSGAKKGQSRRRSSFCNLEWFFKCFLSSVVFFYVGLTVGWNMGSCDCNDVDSGNLRATGGADPVTEKTHKAMAEAMKALKKMGTLVDEHKEKEEEWAAQLKDMQTKIEEQEETIARLNKNTGMGMNLKEMKQKIDDQKEEIKRLRKDEAPHHTNLFYQKHTAQFVGGMEFVNRTDFAMKFDTGVPVDKSGWGNDQVLLLYSDKKALPPKTAEKKTHSDGWVGYSVDDATKNCRNLHIIMAADGRQQQCTAIMGQYESFHVQKFMRMAKGDRQSDRVIDMNLPLRAVNRQMKLTGEKSVSPPKMEITKEFRTIITSYLNSLEGVLAELKPIAQKVASNNQHKTIIVMVCNYGHSDMLMNFACNAFAKGHETGAALGSVLIFATDEETHKLAQGLGLNSFYSETIFGHIPVEAAGEYGDKRYSQIMLSKVYCVHLISQLGYDMIFQDVDIVWYRNPIPFFYNEKRDEKGVLVTEWDMIFQDDGARTLFFAPYSANTGFYFVRNSRLTQYFFDQLLMMGDLILGMSSHQSALIILLAEQASLYGLKIKTWGRMTSEFPGGHSYHQRKDFMKQLILSKNSTDGRGLIEQVSDKVKGVDPYLFHMSWTKSKENKLKYFEQMGEWYVKDECNYLSDKAQRDVLAHPNKQSCCAAKPLMRCHFKDKPSAIPCRDSPSLDKNQKSFW